MSAINQTLGQDGGSLADFIPLAALASQMPRRRRGRKTSTSTLYRWTNGGCRGVKLRYIMVGATRCSTLEWIGQFFDELTQAQTSKPGLAAQDTPGRTPGPGRTPAPVRMPTPVRTSAARLRAHEAAERELAKLGV